ncbi:MAG: DUF4336 domain-containing protein [Pseudomonadota bacterium]
MEPFGRDIWTISGDRVRMFGLLPFTTRMTVVRLESGGLWIHSPVLPTPERQDTVKALGPVEHLVAPNKIHSLGIQPWKRLCPAATVWVSPAFSQRHPDLPADAVLSNDVDAPWRSEIDLRVIDGHRVLDEVAFLHKPSGTLILTDVIQKHDAKADSWIWRRIKAMAGILGPDGGSPLDFKLSVRDRAAMRASFQAILAWNFDKLIIAHGSCLQAGAKQEVSRVLEWITKA